MSNTDDIIDEDNAAESREATAFQSTGFSWKGEKLQPFAIDREATWIQHRHLVGSPPLSEIIEHAPALTLDAIRVLWFCSHDPKEWLEAPDGENVKTEEGLRWKRFTARDRALRLESRILEWGRDRVTGADIPAATNLFYEILNSAHSTHATIVSDGKASGLGN